MSEVILSDLEDLAIQAQSLACWQVHKMPGENADNVHGYIYGLLSICLGALSGIIIYGWSVWT